MIRVVSAALCALIWAGPAIADGMSMPMSHGSGMSAAGKANAAAMHGMMMDMNVKPTGDADEDFARMMLAHHRGAIAMAEVELSYGKDPDMRALAGEIIKAQQAEIARMETWLARR